MKRTTYKYIPPSFPLQLKQVGSVLKVKVTFNESCIYNYGEINQWDWNKLVGIKKSLFFPKKNSFMIGWRWNSDKDRLELTPYYHDGEGNNHFNDRGVFYVSREELKDPITIKIDTSGFNTSFSLNSRNYSYYSTSPCYIEGGGWLINPWWGGTKLPPHKSTIDFEILEDSIEYNITQPMVAINK